MLFIMYLDLIVLLGMEALFCPHPLLDNLNVGSAFAIDFIGDDAMTEPRGC